MPQPELPILAATEIAIHHGLHPDRCEILQNSSTLVVRLTETLVARVVTDVSGPRQGPDWFARENAVAHHLTQKGAPVIPLHPDLPPEPHEHLGFTLNFWLYVTPIDVHPDASQIGHTLHQCHAALQSFSQPLPTLSILAESLALLDTLTQQQLFPISTIRLLRCHLSASIEILRPLAHQPLHGDAHLGNLMNTTIGLLWTDWEDTFSGPVEWDLASAIWNSQLLDHDQTTADKILDAYLQCGGRFHQPTLQQCLIARAAVMSTWYPLLYRNPSIERQQKLDRRLRWLQSQPFLTS